jgi:methionyl-tRNA synthetase
MTNIDKDKIEVLSKKGLGAFLGFVGLINKKIIDSLPKVKSGLEKGVEHLDKKLNNLNEVIDKKEKEVKEEVKNKEKNMSQDTNVKPEENKSEFIGIEDFAKVKLKVGEIKEAHVVEGADKLYRFLVDVGEETGPRTILSGIREFFPDKDIFIGKKVCVVANLAPRKMRGFESNGMLLFAGGDSGKLFAVSPDEDTPVGTTIR